MRIGHVAARIGGGDGFARGRQALLVGVGIGAVDVAGDRALQVFGGAEAEGAGVADVQLDQLAALGLQVAGAPGQLAADLVADLGQALAGGQGAVTRGFDRWGGHRRGLAVESTKS